MDVNPSSADLLLKPVLHSICIDQIKLLIQDAATSSAVAIIVDELQRDCYQLQNLSFSPGDVVIDIGGHVGIFAIYLAKRYPFLTILSFEPIPGNAVNFRANLEHNQIQNINLFEYAVTADGRHLEMLMHSGNTGAGTSVKHYIQSIPCEHIRYYRVPSVRLDTIFKAYCLQRCKLLKIDCEGSEYEILLQTQLLSHIDYICGELHINRHLIRQGFSFEGLQAHCKQFIPTERIRFQCVQMSE